MTADEIYHNGAMTNPVIDYLAHRPGNNERKSADYFARVTGRKPGRIAVTSTGAGPTPELAVTDAIANWEAA